MVIEWARRYLIPTTNSRIFLLALIVDVMHQCLQKRNIDSFTIEIFFERLSQVEFNAPVIGRIVPYLLNDVD